MASMFLEDLSKFRNDLPAIPSGMYTIAGAAIAWLGIIVTNRGHNKRLQVQIQIQNDSAQRKRPAIVEQRGRIGDWEGDTIMGKNRQGALLTMVERKTLYTVIFRLTEKHADLLAQAAISGMSAFKDRVKTITFDNGLEFSDHEKIASALQADIYFAHPYASWERGINENTSSLIRQYFPKGTDFNAVSDEEIQHVVDRLNNRPRKTRGCRSPNELFMGLRADLLAA